VEYPDVERRLLCEELGWRYVATVRKLYHVFMTEDAGAPEIHTDPRIQSFTIDRLTRWLIAGAAAVIVFFAVTAEFFISAIARGTFIVDLLVNTSSLSLLLIPFWLFAVWQPVAYAAGVFKLRRRLRSGIPLEHRKSYKHGAVIRILDVIAVFFLAAVMLGNLALNDATGPQHDRPMSELPSGIPFLRLEDIEPGAALPEPGGDTAGGFHVRSFWRDYSLLVPVQYAVSQNGGLDDSVPGTDAYTVNVTTYYYRPAFRFLTKPVYDALIKQNLIWNAQIKSYRALSTGLFDGAVYAKIDDIQKLIAYKDDEVLVVWYTGGEDLSSKLGAVAAALGSPH